MRTVLNRLARGRGRGRKLLIVAVFTVLCLPLSSLLRGSAQGEVGFVYLDSIGLSEELQQYTWTLCQEREVEYELVLALMWKESGFRVDAVSYNTNGTRDSGLMQINNVNEGWLRAQYGIGSLMDPYENIRVGVEILAGYCHKYGDERTALMAYRMGEGGMLRTQARGVYTDPHAERVLAVRDDYRQRLALAREQLRAAALPQIEEKSADVEQEHDDEEIRAYRVWYPDGEVAWEAEEFRFWYPDDAGAAEQEAEETEFRFWYPELVEEQEETPGVHFWYP